MKFFLDTADLKEIEEANSWGAIAGVTTNPTLYSRVGGKLSDFHEHIKAICDIVQGPVSVSYTHLDVYKRQHQRSSAGLRVDRAQHERFSVPG